MKFKVGAPARVGLVAPNDVEVPAGGTGLDPSSTNFFQVSDYGCNVLPSLSSVHERELISSLITSCNPCMHSGPSCVDSVAHIIGGYIRMQSHVNLRI